ncbi:tRNA pseudouridine synthase-like 1 isoform 2-T2 [Syngnathus typhle]
MQPFLQMTSNEVMSNHTRYLIFFQYIGTKYSGAVKVPPHQLERKGVQDHLEQKESQHPTCIPLILQPAERSVTRAYRVPDDFHARFRALSRTYVYRIALGISHPSQLPLVERDMCWNLRHTELDMEAMREAATMLIGTHDFGSFRAVNSDMPFKNPVKTLDVASIQPGRAFACEHFHREIPFWELTFQSKSFLYKQVRRMTGALVAVGQGRISLTELKDIMEARDTLAYPPKLLAPPRGLFLTRVDYNESDLLLSPKTSTEVLMSDAQTPN